MATLAYALKAMAMFANVSPAMVNVLPAMWMLAIVPTAVVMLANVPKTMVMLVNLHRRRCWRTSQLANVPTAMATLATLANVPTAMATLATLANVPTAMAKLIFSLQ
ncbi:hypothetical protein ATCC90586_011876 [Pythium insidiosum]|nr:hypothetical protein ATCC90586_011876 [Pythium insidiosum]